MIAALALSIALANWPAPTIVWGTHATPNVAPHCGQYHVVETNYTANCSMAFGKAHTIDVSKIAPPNAVGVSLSGLLIISHGTTPGICDLTVWLRPSPAHKWNAYRGQTAEAHVGGGQRSNHAITIPMVDRKFEVWMDANTGGMWPTNCAYGVNYRPDYWIVED